MNRDGATPYLQAIADDPQALQYADGIAWHWCVLLAEYMVGLQHGAINLALQV